MDDYKQDVGPLGGMFEYKIKKDGSIDRQKVVCTLCWKEFSFHRSTTSLKYHINAKHRSAGDLSACLSQNTPTRRRDLRLDLSQESSERMLLIQTHLNNYIPDAALPPGPGSSDDAHMDQRKVYAKCHLQQGIIFGPYVGEMTKDHMPTNLKYAWAIRNDAAFFYVDASDENKSNWMRYVTYRSSEDQHNLIVFQFYQNIYYKVSQPIPEGDELKVWIGMEYAKLLGLRMGENVKCEHSKKETVLELLSDIQFVTLPEPNSFFQTGDNNNQSLPIISDLTTLSQTDANNDSGQISRLSFASSIPGSSAQLTEAISNFLIMDIHPPTLVGGKGFIKLIHSLLPTYKLPAPSLLKKLLNKHHSRDKEILAQMLTTSSNRENENVFDHTAPIEDECRRLAPSPIEQGEVPNFVTISVDVWVHSWDRTNKRYVTLWAHYIDSNMECLNVTLATQRLIECDMTNNCHQSLKAQVKTMANEWGISQFNLVLLGGKRNNKMRLQILNNTKCADKSLHTNSFLQTDESVSPMEQLNLQPCHSSEGLLFVPCFFSVVQDCIDELTSHPVISKTLLQFQGFLLSQLQALCQNKDSCRRPSSYYQSVMETLTEREQAELKSWASHCRPTWNRLYPLLSTLLKHESIQSALLKQVKCENLMDEDFTSEFDNNNCCYANSSSTAAVSNMAPLHSEWKILEELCMVLKPLDVACQTLAKEAFPRLSLIKPILTGLLSCHLVCRPGDSSILNDMKQMVRQTLASHYNNSEVNRILSVACSLDPQFHGLGFMEMTEQMETFDWLKKDTIRIVKDRKTHKSMKIHSSKKFISPEEPESESHLLKRRKLGEVDSKDMEDEEEMALPDLGPICKVSGMEFLLGDLFSTPQSRQDSVEESVDLEISVFRAGKGASLGVEPLHWWRTKAVQFPMLGKVAQVYLAAPAVAGNMAQDFVQDRAGTTNRNRDNIPPESLDAILFLHHNHSISLKNKT
ncbi:E3 SUMO-protein ligase ZBED1-like isoform X2 [Entelurus aequoreus]|uniref:E3 SUMO-protein ligase ZBED1-like isoform X2 n=1 Tax=Entelurus aequoreus TaxID=161455 RepID=UPI002B1E6E9C|nr:E3 SUMO-protein ligase ZBED1-like isoform X2 [Entelurus aequoreus]